jgi:hypothetical protein
VAQDGAVIFHLRRLRLNLDVSLLLSDLLDDAGDKRIRRRIGFWVEHLEFDGTRSRVENEYVLGHWFLIFSLLLMRSLPAARSRGLKLYLAWMAVMATVFTMSGTVAPRDRSFTGLFRPCRIGPTASASAVRCTAL